MSLAIVEAAAASQEPLEPAAIVEAGVWEPRTLRDVEWCLEQIAESEAEQADIDEQLRDLIARATARADKIKAGSQNRVAFFTGRVSQFAEKNKADLLIGKAKSRQFLSGKIGWRRRSGRLVVTEKIALADWLATQDPSLFRIKIEPEMKALQAQVQKDGIIPPGCTWNEEMDELYVEASPLPTLNAAPAKEIK